MRGKVTICWICLSWWLTFPSAGFSAVSELRQAGYSLIPAPQNVQLNGDEVSIDSTWSIEGSRFEREWINRWSDEFYRFEFHGGGPGKVVLGVRPGSVVGVVNEESADQAYRLEIAEDLVRLTGNSAAGLFHGIQSFIQLLKRGQDGRITLPAGTITDWPDLQLRFVHWDFLYHQKRPDSIKRLLDWLALFKVNCIGLEIIDKYEFPRHPIVGCPGAYTKAEMQEFTRYALERHIQLVPVIQGPAHLSYLLKHPEYAHLKADGSNYQACMCDEEAIEVLFDLYQDMIDATPGVDYFHVATDEVYYAGICAKCEREYNPENRSLTWVDFINRAHGWLADRNRRMLAWVEYPLLPKHVPLLPSGLINGVIWLEEGYPELNREIVKEGNRIRQLVYVSMQGAELLFPNYYDTVYQGSDFEGRLYQAERVPLRAVRAGCEPKGSFAAAWDTSGLHDETFWLGWVTVTQYAWSVRTPAIEQSVADFMDVFHGPGNHAMVEIYQLLQRGARFWEDGWDQIPSRERPPAYGNSRGPGIGVERWDLTLDPPSLALASDPTAGLGFARRNAERLALARAVRDDLDRLIGLLTENMGRVARNRYNLELLLSIAKLERHYPETILTLEQAERALADAGQAYRKGDAAARTAHLAEAAERTRKLLDRREKMWQDLVTVWEKSRYAKNRGFDGRDYLDIGSDVKDGFAGRRPGLEYLVAPFQRMQLEDWLNRLEETTSQTRDQH